MLPLFNKPHDGPHLQVELGKADALAYMMDLSKRGDDKFDIVICDPPKLAPTRGALAKAKNKYVKINTAALKLVKPGGLLLTFSCSAAVTQSGSLKDFVSEAAIHAGKDVNYLSSMHAAKDHVVHSTYKEGEYLSGLICCVR